MVVTYNGPRHVARFLRSLRLTQGVDYELVVVDNASRRPTRLLLMAAALGGLIDRLALLDRNTLFSPGVNTALALSDSRSRYVLLVNPDTVVRDPQWMLRMLSAHRRGATGLRHIPGNPWPRADGFCLLVDRDLFRDGLSEDYHWWWAVTALQADLLRKGHTVQAVEDYDDVLRHVGGGSGSPPLTAKGMDVDLQEVIDWFDGRHADVLERLPHMGGAVSTR